MASTSKLDLAVRLLQEVRGTDTNSQASLVDQAKDCIAIVQALGYYDLADYLSLMVRESNSKENIRRSTVPEGYNDYFN